MASFVHLGKALKDRRGAKSLAAVFIRHGSGSRGRDLNPAVKSMRSDMIGCAGGAGAAVPIPSPSGHVRFLPIGATATKVDTTAAMAAKQMQMNELAAVAAASCASNSNSVNGNVAEKVGQGLLYGRRRKRSSETIRHDKLYLQTSDVSKREYTQTWNDFQDKRSIPNTEWGKRLNSDD